MATDSAKTENVNPARCRDAALKDAKSGLAEASKKLKAAASYVSEADDLHDDLELLSEEALDVYMRVASLCLRLDAESSAETPQPPS